MASDRLYAHINYSRNYLELGKVFNWTRDVSAKEESREPACLRDLIAQNAR